jgi:hypothetical protein
MQKDRIAEWFGGCCEDEELGVGRKLTEPSREAIFDPGGNEMTLRQPEAAGKVRGAQDRGNSSRASGFPWLSATI